MGVHSSLLQSDRFSIDDHQDCKILLLARYYSYPRGLIREVQYSKIWSFFGEARAVFYDENAVQFFYPNHSADEDCFILFRMSQVAGPRCMPLLSEEGRSVILIIVITYLTLQSINPTNNVES